MKNIHKFKTLEILKLNVKKNTFPVHKMMLISKGINLSA